MINALGRPQTVLLLGGTSDIALALARSWAHEPGLYVVLAARPGPRRDAAAAELEQLGCVVEPIDFEATDTARHPALIESVASGRDIDVAVVAFGVLGDEERAWQDHETAVHLAEVNYVAPVSVGVCLAERLRRQGHGVIVALSSVAGERVRRSNFAYGASKAGMDGFYLGLGEALRGSGARVLVVRPGFVHTKMTAGRDAAPLSVSAEQVASAVTKAVASGDDLIWVPAAMRGVMSGLRHVPRSLFRRLPI
ncbi:decaprenylphospho-beta-D-erythro-pentofuranosid-2-ulose 2-reductase [Nocardioides soli]|uniref:Decaprenylphospho-beta-D-erythro-pentofuranosid-2-ulose 2-reductase n=1 Tax=Nocardioides soli TaxID=1036020 RepID=A0A7W4VR72_9ACTN|nr:decaprenylphospho-beta-D-erythro-pentofuranosid-2-ulose 2-reductase [Nocardioides soli]MBB3040270.1 decaprenylphospho-beta-D-erythro-pentofuranosid-2-ulose 2-reductase [Nocardioides soli]